MATVLLLAVLLGSLVAIILMIYLIDRVKRLEMLSIQASNNSASQPEAQSDNGFLGLSGKGLWDAMSGKIPDNFNQADLLALKPRFAFVLQNHIETLFKLGKKDASDGNVLGTPKNPVEISTLRGAISSWLPTQSAATIYKTGYESVEADEIDINRLSADLDEAASGLYARVEINNSPAFSERLLPTLPAAAIPNAEMLEEPSDEEPPQAL